MLVVGGAAASIGLYAVSIASALGAGSCATSTTTPTASRPRRPSARRPRSRPAEWPRRFERALITVDNTADADGTVTTLRSTEPYGTCTSVAIHFAPTTPLPLLEMYTRGVTFHLSRADSRRFLPEVLDLVAAGVLDPTAVPTTTVPWERAEEAWLEPATKLVIERERGVIRAAPSVDVPPICDTNCCPRFALPSRTRDPPSMTLAQQGTQVALRGLNRLAQLDLIDRAGLRGLTERLVYRGTRNGFKAANAAGRSFAAVQKLGRPAASAPRQALRAAST